LPALPRQRVKLAVLFADISDSTRLYERMGDNSAFAQIKNCLDILAAVTTAHAGWVIKNIGDGVMCAFPDADAAAVAACEMQRRIAERPLTDGCGRMSIRVGFHCGHVLREGIDVFGDNVNIAARIASMATPSHIAMTSATAAMLSPDLNLRIRKLTALPVKGKQQAIDVHEIAWEVDGQDTHVSGHFSNISRLIDARLNVEYQQKKLIFVDSFTLGRDQSNDLVIADPMASRNHARVEKRKDQFVLVDQSANGTYVTVTGRKEITLRRSEFILYGSGEIAFGDSPVVRPDVATLRFYCESAGKLAPG